MRPYLPIHLAMLVARISDGLPPMPPSTLRALDRLSTVKPEVVRELAQADLDRLEAAKAKRARKAARLAREINGGRS